MATIIEPRHDEHLAVREVVTAVSIVIPAFNEQGAVESTLTALTSELTEADIEFEVIVVNDGSTDNTSDILRDIPEILVINQPVNRGYGASLKVGIRQAKNPWIVITDADGTYPAESIEALIRKSRHADMVVGARNGANTHHPRFRRFAKWFLKRFAQWMARQPIPDLNSGLRIFRKDVAERFLNILPDGFSFTTTITLAMMTNGYVVLYEPVDYLPRIGRSKIRPVRDTLKFVQLILRTGMYFAPLRVFMPIAALFWIAFFVTLTQDFLQANLNERTLLLLIAATQTAMFALLADMIDKRS